MKKGKRKNRIRGKKFRAGLRAENRRAPKIRAENRRARTGLKIAGLKKPGLGGPAWSRSLVRSPELFLDFRQNR